MTVTMTMTIFETRIIPTMGIMITKCIEYTFFTKRTTITAFGQGERHMLARTFYWNIKKKVMYAYRYEETNDNFPSSMQFIFPSIITL